MKTIVYLLSKPLTWLILLLLMLLFSLQMLQQLKKETLRLNWNQSQILQTQQELQLSNGRIAAQYGVLTLKQNELGQLYPRLLQEMKTLGIKARKAEILNQTAFAGKKQFEVVLKDSVVFPNPLRGIYDTQSYKSFQYRDNYYAIEGISLGNKQWVSLNHWDTMTQVVYRRRKHKWLWIFSPNVLEQRVYFKNPNAHVSYSQSIKIVK